MPMSKPFSQACENNKTPILQILKSAFAKCTHVLEIGSGTGQHAVFFASQLPHLIWQTSDQPGYHEGIHAWINEFPSVNLRPPISLTVGETAWPSLPCDGVFTANTAHIMQKHEAKLMMEEISAHLPEGGVFCQYGPFTRDGEFSSQSNQNFHSQLIDEGYGGYRDISELRQWAKTLTLTTIYNMPANNLMLVWKK
ncbi:class I SAM-dependent methyltransferase [Alteromonas ponticola]|uniref:Class I SAM-dependent methyltransferase n=1 Tax=Alteromonas aquimaris TaxID=2998417 RepID=A0ABT3P4F8_9ALTE|nr:DUF938 domain-containing protein [Alteromonas aquimaris]MCW8107652.1 class I SAM-dependent methyltransferase [Alteromonas aquimaris]